MSASITSQAMADLIARFGIQCANPDHEMNREQRKYFERQKRYHEYKAMLIGYTKDKSDVASPD